MEDQIPFNIDELQYLNLLNNVLNNGYDKPSRTGNTTRSITGTNMRFKLHKDGKDILPLITTKKVNFNLILTELLWFLRGETNSKTLSADGNKIWDPNSSREFLDKSGLNRYEEGELGPIYGYQWRKWNKPYKYQNISYNELGYNGIDQIMNVINNIINDPWSRRHIVSAWNPEQIKYMALPPCVTGDTTLITPNGNKSIENIIPGDFVMSYRGAFIEVVQKFITNTYNMSGFLIKCEDHDDTITLTFNHKLLYTENIDHFNINNINYNWTKARDFKTGGYLGIHNGINVIFKKIIKITKIILNEKVYDIGLRDEHIYIANGFVSHNCHSFFQFIVRPDGDKPRFLDCVLHQRSGDLPLGIPFNIASYSCLTHIIAKMTNLTAGEFIHNIADTHIYHNQFEGVHEQCKRIPYDFPEIEINIPQSILDKKDIDNLKQEYFNIVNYKYHPFIKYPFSI